jgi:hypothetical protein
MMDGGFMDLVDSVSDSGMKVCEEIAYLVELRRSVNTLLRINRNHLRNCKRKSKRGEGCTDDDCYVARGILEEKKR